MGRFLIPAPPDEEALIRGLVARALANDVKPNEAWMRMEATRDAAGRTLVGHRTYHVDLNAGTVEITEGWDGVTTARDTRPVGTVSH